MPFNGKGEWYNGTPLDIVGSYNKGAQARSNYYDTQAKQMELEDKQNMRKAVNLYGDYGTAPGVGPDDLRQMYADQGLPIQGQQVIKQVDAPRQQKLSNMALASLSIDDPTEQKEAFKYIHSQLTPQEQQQFGSPDKWTRANIVGLIGNDDVKQMVGLWKDMRKGKEEVLSTPQLYTNPKNNRQEMWYFDKAGNPKSFVRTANKKDLEGGKSGSKEESLKELLGPYQKWATEEPDRWALATDIASEGYDRGLTKFQIQKAIGEKINNLDQAQLEEARAKKKSGGWGDFLSGLFGKKAGVAPAQGQPSTAKPMSALPNPAQHKGKTIVELDAQGKPTGRKLRSDGKNWIRASAGPVNLALNAEDVPLGTGMASQAKSLVQLRKELNDAYLQGDDQRAADIERQIQQIANQQRNIG